MISVLHDRAAQLVMASDRLANYQEARRRLDAAGLRIIIGSVATSAWGQAALLTAIACASRMFSRGVFVEVDPAIRCVLPLYGNRTLACVARDFGAQLTDIPADAFKLQIGADGSSDADLYCQASGWSAHISYEKIVTYSAEGNELSGAFAAALAVASAFRFRVLGDVIAIRRTQSINLWDAAPSADIRLLPTELWCVGLGNLGQAALLVLSMLPYGDAEEVHLLLQDPDVVGPENVPVQVLTRQGWMGQKKARAVAIWAEQLGFQTTVSERLFGPSDSPTGEEPRIVLAGVDNLKARRLIASAPFSLVVDAGLGASGAEAFDLRLHAFPGRKTAQLAWPELPSQSTFELPAALAALVDEGAISRCGALSVAGKAVGVPCTALATGVLQLTQVVRAIGGGGYADIVDLSLRDTNRAVMQVSDFTPVVPFQRALRR